MDCPMSTLVRYLPAFVFLIVPAITSAGDAASVAAALKDGAAECRYLKQLCDKARASVEDVRKRVAREAACDAQPPIGRGADPEALKQSPCYGIGLEPNARARAVVASAQISDVKSVVEVLRAKHEKPPKCIDECNDLLRLAN